MISCNQEEYQALNLYTKVLKYGDERKGRNGAITRSIFGNISEYSLHDDTLPLFTTKKVFFRGVVEELLWMIRGSTDANELKKKNIHIWDAHSSREHLDKTGLEHYREGDIGAGYGFQFRHCGAEYVDCDTDYSGQGVDQLANVIEGIKKDPFSRRHIINAWNPSDIPKMALTPCHAMMQFYVDSEDGLSCMMTQRSCDLGLGHCFNVASYSILTMLIAKCCNLAPRKFTHSIGDAHIYEPHYDAVGEQTMRVPFNFPKLKIDKELNNVEDLEQLQFEDFELIDYQHHPKIKMDIVV